jgi:hypothetical protein
MAAIIALAQILMPLISGVHGIRQTLAYVD